MAIGRARENLFGYVKNDCRARCRTPKGRFRGTVEWDLYWPNRNRWKKTLISFARCFLFGQVGPQRVNRVNGGR